jgi:hypothetical protein
MDLLIKHVYHIILNFKQLNNVKQKLQNVKNIKLEIIVYQNNYKILSNKFSIMDQLLL